MASNTEKRLQARYRSSDSVVCWSFGTNRFRDARVVNFSEDGLCIESVVPFPEGATVFLRVDDVQTAPAAKKRQPIVIRTAATAEVKWCSELILSGRQLFIIGMKYFYSEH